MTSKSAMQSLHVALHPVELRTLDRTVAKQPRKIRLLEPQKIGERRGAVFSASHKTGIGCCRRGVPGTSFLADVATKRVSGERQILGQRTAMLDRHVADAALRGDGPIRKNGIGGTGIDAPRARAATICDRGRGDVVFPRRQ